MALSDVHLGAFNTTWIFFNDVRDPLIKEVFRGAPQTYWLVRARPGWALCDQLGASIRAEVAKLGGEFAMASKKTLVLNGDILDLSLSPTAFACLSARCFFHWVREFGFNEVVYVPGNHDHHLWRTVIEGATLHEAVAKGETEYSRTNAVPTAAVALEALLGVGVRFKVAYPHYVHELPAHLTSSARAWRLVFHHGHLLERWWTLLSTIVSSSHGRPHTMEDLEAINEPLTELLWFGVGDAGRLSDVVSQFYSGARNRAAMRAAVRRAMDDALGSLEDRWGVTAPWWMPRAAIVTAASRLVAFLAVKRPQKSRIRLTSSMLRGSSLDAQLRGAATTYRSLYASETPSCFIIGHTHRTQPQEWVDHWLNLAAEAQSGATAGFDSRILNTGGWVVEPGTLTPDASYFLSVGAKVKLVRVELPEEAVQAARRHANLNSA